jgi:HlyD family secretion protein
VVARITLWLIVTAAIAAPISYVYFYETPIEVVAIPLTKGHVEQTVSAISSGTVIAGQDSMIHSGYIGTVSSIPVTEGERVEEGALLVDLNHADLDAQVELARANLEAGQSRHQSVKIAADIYKEIAATRVSLAKSQLDAATQDFDRIKKLSNQGGASPSDLDKFSLAMEVAGKNLASATASQKENKVRALEILAAASNVKQLEAALAVATAMREKAFVRAPFAGIIARILLDVGEAVGVGIPLLQLVQDSYTYVEAPFDEANASEIAIGQKARVNLDAHRGTDFIAEVVYISPIVSLNPDLSRTLNVKLRIVEGRDKFIVGMSADVTILANEKSDVLFVPSESLIREQWAYIVKDGRAVRREVETGVGNWDRKEVLGGIALGEALITSVSVKDLADGVRVTVVDELSE